MVPQPDRECGPGVVLLSGGLDSGTALGLRAERLAAEGSTAGSTALFFDYGQPAAGAERRAARRLAERFDAEWCEIQMPWLGRCADRVGSGLAPGAVAAGPEAPLGDEASAQAVWVPARNLVFLAAAAAEAESRGAGALVVGFNREEAETFPDNRASFVESFDGVLVDACRSPVRVEAPLLGLDKAGIVREARRLGLAREDFWSCYRDRSPDAPCDCESCRRSARAWAT